MKLDYEECSLFFKNTLKIKLFPYQEEMLKAFCEDKVVWNARCAGRTMILKGMQQYLDSLKEKLNKLNDIPKTKNPDLTIDYRFVVNAGLMSQKMVDEAINMGFKNQYACS